MTHYAFRSGPELFEAEADYVVVGSGAGGATAAVTLARAGEDVMVVEAGAWRRPQDYPSSGYGAMRDLFDDWGANITRGRAFWPILQARAVGGTTVINSAICVRTPGDILEMWAHDFGVGGSDMAQALWSHQDDLERELSAQAVPLASMGRSNHLAVQGSREAGYQGHVTTRYAKDCDGHGQCLQGCRKGRKQSMNVTFLPEVLSLGGSLVSSAPVHKVHFRGRRAERVTGWFVHPRTKARGAAFSVRARKGIIVSASATHSPALLLRSGLRSRALGYYFRAHPGSGVFGCYDDPVDMNIGATQGWATTHFRDTPGVKLETLSMPLELVASRLSGGGPTLMERLSEFRHMAMWVHAIRAESVGWVGRAMGGRAMVRYQLNRRDMERFRESTYLVAALHIAAGARHVIPGVYGLPYRLGPDEIGKIREASLDPRAYFGVLSHLFGGCVMGADPRRSVVDGWGRVHHKDNLYVMDASVLPSVLGVNPQHTIMALARHFSQGLLDGRAEPRARTVAVRAQAKAPAEMVHARESLRRLSGC